jgi:hypothetical protein
MADADTDASGAGAAAGRPARDEEQAANTGRSATVVAHRTGNRAGNRTGNRTGASHALTP